MISYLKIRQIDTEQNVSVMNVLRQSKTLCDYKFFGPK